MKKFLAALSLVLLLSTGLFAQEAEEAPVTGGGSSAGFEFRLGLNGQFQPVVGDLADFVKFNVGGGLIGEFDLPIALPYWVKLGIPVSVYGNGNIRADDVLSSLWNLQATTGFYARFLLANNNFIIQPELEYGVALYFPKANPEYGNEIASLYTDQVIQFALNFRYAPQNVMNGAMEFSIAPVYSFSPEEGGFVHYVGGRLGILFRIM